MDNLADNWGKGKKILKIERERRISYILNNTIIFFIVCTRFIFYLNLFFPARIKSSLHSQLYFGNKIFKKLKMSNLIYFSLDGWSKDNVDGYA